jgi:hypothetical protein
MAHPSRVPDDDPYLERLRRLCLLFPSAEERVSHGRVTFRARLLFAVYGGTTRATSDAPARQYPRSVLLPVPEVDRAALAQDDRFFVPAYYGPAGWSGLDLDAAPVDWQEVAELLDAAYREVAGPRLVARLDEVGSPAAGTGRRPGAD